jgi:hypothetical protein
VRKRLSYANVTATLALVFAMSGGALAAHHYLINSTKQINPKVLSKLKGRTGKTGPAGPQGLAGAPGAKGETGPPGPTKLSTIKQVFGTEVFVASNKTGTSRATCPAGTRVVSGGVDIESENVAPNFEISKAMAELKGWEVEIGNPFGSGESIFVEAIAYCAGEGEAVAASRISSPAAATRR